MQYSTHYIRHIESIDIPFYSPFLATKYANRKPSGIYTTTVQDMLQGNSNNLPPEDVRPAAGALPDVPTMYGT